jgi:Zn-dependent protease with chaperone function
VSRAHLALLAAFDLLLNAPGSFLVAALVVAVAVRLFRVGPGRAAQVLWAVPFVKTFFDAARGIPGDAFFWARFDGVVQRLGAFMAGGGFVFGVPTLQLRLGAVTEQGRYPSTVADLAATFLYRRVGPGAPAAVAVGLLAVAAARITARVGRLLVGEGERARLRAHARLLGTRRAGGREVEVFVSPEHRGAPFAGGVLRAYVCFPEAAFAALSPDERDAALEHELAHVAHRDLLLATALDLAGDVLWFVPGAGAVRRRFDAACEHLADGAAVRAGASPVSLAAALVRVHELVASHRAGPRMALLRPRSVLARRVAALLAPGGPGAPGPRLGFQRRFAGPLLTGVIAAAALLSVLGGHR